MRLDVLHLAVEPAEGPSSAATPPPPPYRRRRAGSASSSKRGGRRARVAEDADATRRLWALATKR